MGSALAYRCYILSIRTDARLVEEQRNLAGCHGYQYVGRWPSALRVMTKHTCPLGWQPTSSSSCRCFGGNTAGIGIMGKSVKQIASIVAERAFPLSARGVVDKIPKGAEWVLIGEASHGTREFYETRAGEQSQTFLHGHDNLSSGNVLKNSALRTPVAVHCRDHQSPDQGARLQCCCGRSRCAEVMRCCDMLRYHTPSPLLSLEVCRLLL